MSDPERLFGTALYDSTALRLLEASAERSLGDASELMRRAGQAAWRALLARWPHAHRIVVVCGPGNNGGDGYVLARHALESGREVQVLAWPDPAPRTDLARKAQAAFTAAGGQVTAVPSPLPDAELIVDALFGIGLHRAPDPATAMLIEAMNAHGAPVFALDVPSGLDADRGTAPGACVNAVHTLEFIVPKAGLRTGDALDRCGSLALASLDVEASGGGAVAVAHAMRPTAMSQWLAPRARNSHKGRHGRVLCIGGDQGMGGAILLCAEAALRTGAGLVDVATRPGHVASLLARLPEAMARNAEDAEAMRASFDSADAIAVGPGLGRSAWARTLVARVIDARRPAVIDADALTLVADAARTLPADAVITPHPGEAARLLGVSAADVQRDRFAAIRALRDRSGCIVVLKGAGTLVDAPGRGTVVIEAGNPGMAVGGMGDVLTGVIAALRAQGLPAYEAAVCGALLHAHAGDSASMDGERGMLPSDLMPWLRHHANPRPFA